MKKIIITSFALAIAGCGPSEQEIQARIDKEVAQKVETLRAEMRAERAAEKAAELEAAAAAEAKRKAEEKAADDARLAKEAEEQAKREASNKAARDAIMKKIRLANAECDDFNSEPSIGTCSLTKSGNYYTFRIWAWTQDYFNKGFNKVIFVPFDFPPDIVSKIEATSAVMDIKEARFGSTKLSWDIAVGKCETMIISRCETSVKFNLEVM